MGEVPAIVKRHRYVRRGSVDAPPFVIDTAGGAAAEERLTAERAAVVAILDEPGTPEPLATAGHAWLDGDPGVTPAGAAVVLAALSTRLPYWEDTAALLTPFADVWIARHGLLFAARAAVEFTVLAGRERKRADPMHRGALYLAEASLYDNVHRGPHRDILLRVRAALAPAPDSAFAEVVAALRPYRDRSWSAAVATSVLLPGEADWVEQDVRTVAATGSLDRHQHVAALLLMAAGTAEQIDALAPHLTSWWNLPPLRLFATLADGAGPAAAGTLLTWLDVPYQRAETQQRLLSVLAELDDDAVFEALLARLDRRYVPGAVLDAAARFPARAMRLFAETGSPMLRAHLVAHPDLVEEVLPTLGPDAAGRVRELASAAAAVTYAPLSAVPPVLASPPWLHRIKPPKPVVIEGLSCDDPETAGWRAGERDRWLNTPGDWGSPWFTWERIAELVTSAQNESHAPTLFTGGPDEIVRPILATWRPAWARQFGPWVRVAAARFGIDALPLVRDAAERLPAMVDVLMPFSSPSVAVFMADRYSRMKSARPAALTWLLRHADVAARALIPPALGKVGPARRQAETALLVLPAETVVTAASGYGPAASAAIATLLARDPLMLLPARLPVHPAWAVPAILPPIRLRDGSGALPPATVEALITMLAISTLEEPYAGITHVAAACEPGDLAEFGWELFEAWQRAGADAKQGWVLDALALLGDDTTVQRLTPLILAWPGEGGHAKAVTGVRVLAAIGSDVALTRLYGIAQRAKFKGLKTAAEEKITEVADGLGLAAEQLADRLVPDFGLAADGSLTLDYGTRRFQVGFDEQLKPYVADAAGKRLRDLPKPATPVAEESRRRFAALKKDVRAVAADQVRRLEQAMVAGRRWTPDEFSRYFAGHPLLGHIVRRLVWTVSNGDAFRMAEDRSYADVTDEPYTLPGDVTVGVAHPLDLAGALAGWSEIFADYEILQPFPQLARETYPAADEDLKRLVGAVAPAGRLLGLERRGWRRTAPEDAGVQNRVERITGGLTVVIELDPGIAVGLPEELGDQKLEDIYVHGQAGRQPFAALGPVAASEVIRDLTLVTEAGGPGR
ncbi:DUF4132 domain-containing protein [Actinoplanes utahensis]|uniref:DUF4132 domain-containing protein n=1 Tax=Actinoplanes utahensis TaxID=1869 RepID=UPI000689FB8C|nr:DUF4132 domain-containing protein [Actinoplanes utahensis]GIF32336.1 hypothetical protein Aut01nite_53220 [Actinoplanes utahensis]